ncbi:MAG: MBL fold metallo-hydrolase [Myxococcaceae bacterium]|jgi:glyoxylase-like metal-dependent hydrolase (beta-lactamase superfamily II)|nr:MBL fold metallo-hydrolase [Myxococcaceae bacterium]
MQIEPFFDERTFTLTYVVFDEATRDAVIIDPVLDYEPSGGKLWTESLEKVAAFVDGKALTVHFVLETHAHADHLSGSQWLKKRYGSKVGISRRITEVQGVFKDVFALHELPTDGRQFDVLLDDGQVLQAGSLSLKALATPGHTPACMSFELGDAVFTGDVLFLDDVGVGRCDFPKGDAAALYDSVTTKLFSLPDETRLFVGHDYPPAGRSWRAMTTVGSAKRSNAQLTAVMAKATFVDRRTARDRTLAPPRLLFPSVQVNINGGHLPAAQANGRRYLVTPLTGL